MLCNVHLRLTYFSEMWKLLMDDVNKYRSLMLLQDLRKVLRRLIRKRIVAMEELYSLLQYGFVQDYIGAVQGPQKCTAAVFVYIDFENGIFPTAWWP